MPGKIKIPGDADGDSNISRREFIQKSALLTGSVVTASALGDFLGAKPAHGAQVDPNDPALVSGAVKYPSVDGVGLSGYLSRPKGDD